MKINKTDIDTLNSSISIEIAKEDYKEKFDSELNKYRSKAQLKGFRKGKTPIAYLKKMYGKGILAEAVNESLQKGLFDFIKEKELNILGDPLPSENQEMVDFDPNDFKSYTFTFDIGMSPDFDVKGVAATDSYPLFNIEVDKAVVDEELDVARKRQGTQKETKEQIEDKDILTLEAKELDGADLKKGGWDTGFTVMTELIGDDKLRAEVLKMKVGDSFDFDIYNIEKDKDEAHVKKYFLNLDPEEEKEIGNMFRAKIAKVQRLEPAEMNQEFFDKYFGPDKASTEDEAREKIKEEIGKYYEGQAKSFMYRDMLEGLVEENQFPLPEAFLKRWLKATNEKVTEEDIDKQFSDFLKNLKWTLIRGELAKQYKVEVGPEEIKASFENQVKQYFGPYGMDNAYVQQTIEKLMSDRNQVNKVYEELLSNKVFQKVEEEVQTVEEKISLDDFKQKVKEINERLNP